MDPENEKAVAPSNFDAAGNYIGLERLTLSLSRVVKLHDTDLNPLSEITLVEPTIEQMSAFQDEVNKSHNDFKAGAVLIQMNAGITVPQSRKLSTRDFQKAITFLTGFIPPGLEDEKN